MSRVTPRWATGLAAIGLLLMSGCSVSAASGGCKGGEKCPAPPLPATTVHLKIGGKSAAVDIGQTMRAVAKPGVPIKVTMSIDRTTPDVNVTNVWLTVQTSSPSGNSLGATAPFRHFVVLAGRKCLLRPSETLSATWVPTAPAGAGTVDLGISVDLGDSRTDWPIATVTVS